MQCNAYVFIGVKAYGRILIVKIVAICWFRGVTFLKWIRCDRKIRSLSCDSTRGLILNRRRSAESSSFTEASISVFICWHVDRGCISSPFPQFSSFCTVKFGECARTETGERSVSFNVPRTQVLPFFRQFSSSVFASFLFSLILLIFEGSKETTFTLVSLLLCIDFAHMNIQRCRVALCITASSHRVNCFVESRSFFWC